MFRLLFRLLMNEKLIEKLSDSYPIRRAAKWVVYFIHKTKAIQEQHKLPVDSVKGLTEKLTEALKNVRDDLERRSKK